MWNKSIYPPLVALLWCGLVLVAAPAKAQGDSILIRNWMTMLADTSMAGRGYVQGGMQRAESFIIQTLAQLQLVSERQPFRYPVNTFPGMVSLSINGKRLIAGKDFLVQASSPAMNGSGKLVQADSVTWLDAKQKLVIHQVEKLTWSVATAQSDVTVLEVLKTSLPKRIKSYTAIVEAKLEAHFEAANICAIIPGSRRPDSLVVFTAHYDHLGKMGNDVFFPGANDNAGGAAMLLALARHYKQSPADYSVAFIFFAGEEAGLIGSKYFIEYPLFPLERIRMLINLDLVGNGAEGITVVNASEFPTEFARLQQVNSAGGYFNYMGSRGKAANSDHYWFFEKGIPSFFIYTMGPRKSYHDIYDVAKTVPLSAINQLFRLVTTFAELIMQPSVAD